MGDVCRRGLAGVLESSVLSASHSRRAVEDTGLGGNADFCSTTSLMSLMRFIVPAWISFLLQMGSVYDRTLRFAAVGPAGQAGSIATGGGVAEDLSHW